MSKTKFSFLIFDAGLGIYYLDLGNMCLHSSCHFAIKHPIKKMHFIFLTSVKDRRENLDHQAHPEESHSLLRHHGFHKH